MESNKDGFTIQDIEISCEPRNENIINNNEINLLCKCTLKITLSHNQETPVEKQIRFCINSAPTFELYSYDYGDENIPVSFAMAGDRFSVNSATKIDKTQRYSFSFLSNQDNNYITNITVSNITKTFIFNKEKRTSYLNLGDIVPWSKDVNLSNLNMLKIQTELIFPSLTKI